jgi:hypothetical protein
MNDDIENNYIFVFYDGFRIALNDVPTEWKLVSSGLTCNCEPSPTKYKYFMQYRGPYETRDETTKFIKTQLDGAIDSSCVKSYLIQNTFLPVPV